ncbi:LysR family transcriptional regulator [Burkholderia vietnamiensis]|uniref:LysR family transcriptional regulator n=1 Tax=Burkholderia vietnamiensis TaxID=60552 RepID=UPI001D133EEE|nr:LysR family transcriptional regulator [Burkholderia vietnamiensis]UEC01747.1 LysR family transcriptional regulator [Burkholderia vietnamiensis]
MANFDSAATVKKLASRLKMRHLTLLLAIESHGSLTRAAEHVGSSQPAVTNALADLESMFGAPLFERTARGMVATPLGEAVLSRARGITQDVDHLVCDMEAIALGRAAQLQVGVTTYVSGQRLTDAIQGTPEKGGRRIAFSVHEGSNEQLLEQLDDHRLDVVIGRATSQLQVDRYWFEILRKQHPRLIAGRRLASRLTRRRLDWSELSELDWILGPTRTHIREQISDIFLEAGLVPPQPIVEMASPKLIGDMVVANERAVSIVPDDTADDLVRTTGVSIVPFSFDWSLAPIAIFTRIDIRSRDNVRLFAESAIKTFCEK